MKFQMGDIETQVVCYKDGTVAHRRQPISHQPQFSFEQLTELVRRWNSYEDLLATCEYTQRLLLKGFGQQTHAVAMLEAAIKQATS